MPQKPHQSDHVLALIVFALVILGLIMISSASVALSYEKFGHNYYYLKHQFLYGLLPGLFFLIVCYKIPYHLWKKLAPILLFVTLALLIAVFIPKIGVGYGGARRWVHIGPFLLQPTEICKLSFIIYLSAFLAAREKKIKSFYLTFVPFIIVIGLIGFLIMRQPDMSTALVIILTGLGIYFVAGAPLWSLVLLCGGGLGAIWGLIKIAPYRMARFTVFLHPEVDPQGIGYQINQALLAIGSGGILGLGFGHSRQKYLYLPEATGDSIFAILAEELGFIGCVVLIGLFFFLAFRGFKIAQNIPDTFGKLVATGITCWFIIQAFVNMAGMTSLVPLTGIPLPFISYGGSALVVSLAGVGILLNISRHTVEPRRGK